LLRFLKVKFYEIFLPFIVEAREFVWLEVFFRENFYDDPKFDAVAKLF
jgi:hypothetical protein